MAEQEKPQPEKPQPEKPQPEAAAPARPAARPEASPRPSTAPKGTKRSWKTVTFAKVFVQSSFNNTIVTLTDDRGSVLCWASAGSTGFKGTKKGTPFAAQMTAAKVAKRAIEMGVKQVTVFVKGPGPGRETAIRALHANGLQVLSLKDVSPLPHNGCRPPKQRRV
jgi:small subunit ribosomal protein S11